MHYMGLQYSTIEYNIISCIYSDVKEAANCGIIKYVFVGCGMVVCSWSWFSISYIDLGIPTHTIHRMIWWQLRCGLRKSLFFGNNCIFRKYSTHLADYTYIIPCGGIIGYIYYSPVMMVRWWSFSWCISRFSGVIFASSALMWGYATETDTAH